MSQSGINYFYDYLGLDTSNFTTFFDFSTNTGATLPSIANASPTHSGEIIGSTGTFISNGSGIFSGSTYVKIQNIDRPTFSGDSTFLFVYEKPSSGAGILFSSLTGTTFKSGYNIGINDANRLYFEYYDNEGPVLVTSNNIYGQKNAVAVGVSLNNVSFNYYNFNSFKLESEDFFIDSSYLLFSDQWHLGKNIATYLPINQLTGNLDLYAHFNTVISKSNLTRLFSGLYAIPSGFPAVSGEVITTGVVGYNYSFTGATGITGFNFNFTGFSGASTGSGNCSEYPIFSINQISGYLNGGYIMTPVYGPQTGYYILSEPYTGYNINSGYIDTFGMDHVSYNWRPLMGSNEIYVLTGVNQAIYLNIQASFDNVQGDFSVNNFYTSGNLNVFKNGLFQVESGYTESGEYYDLTKYKIGDFYIDNQYLISDGENTSTDIFYYDYNQQQNRVIVNYTGEPILTNSNPKMVWLNGQKLISGQDYTFSAPTYTFSTGIQNVTGKMLLVNNYTGQLRDTGNYNRYSGVKFVRNTSMYYLNGVRLPIDFYIEHAKIDMVSGSGIFDTSYSVINNNDSNYWG